MKNTSGMKKIAVFFEYSILSSKESSREDFPPAQHRQTPSIHV
jgi:hypothetical protein